MFPHFLQNYSKLELIKPIDLGTNVPVFSFPYHCQFEKTRILKLSANDVILVALVEGQFFSYCGMH